MILLRIIVRSHLFRFFLAQDTDGILGICRLPQISNDSQREGEACIRHRARGWRLWGCRGGKCAEAALHRGRVAAQGVLVLA